ncbi:hypothetical protein ACRALDRAFT_2019651 [Sodiomyces alcalophilus JCM 7366]|uniref:uncharacterized protein n=1 Tax=Sodiomyces alcalophilus JCM 7366 TaxID=591952 RepID=UPI0039B5B0D2
MHTYPCRRRYRSNPALRVPYQLSILGPVASVAREPRQPDMLPLSSLPTLLPAHGLSSQHLYMRVPCLVSGQRSGGVMNTGILSYEGPPPPRPPPNAPQEDKRPGWLAPCSDPGKGIEPSLRASEDRNVLRQHKEDSGPYRVK